MSDELAIHGGTPAVVKMFPAWPYHDELEPRLLNEVLESGTWWKVGGEQTRRFELEFGAAHGALHALTVTNGTHALELALRALGIGPGDEVIIPSMTFAATATAVFMAGARPKAVDVDPQTWCLDPQAVEDALTPATRAVMPVHFAGLVADMDRLGRLCAARGIHLIEDACHAHGATRGGRFAGSFGIAAAFSFQNFKLMTAGEGGALLINDEEIYQRAVLAANCGRDPRDTNYQHVVLGSNYRMSEFQAAVLNAQLSRLDEFARRRVAGASYLDRRLSDVGGLKPQRGSEASDRHAHYMYVCEYDEQEFGGVSRDQFVLALKAEGVPATRMYPRVQDLPFYSEALAKAGGNPADQPACPVALRMGLAGFWLHHRALLGDQATVEQIYTAIAKVQRNHAMAEI